MSRSVMAGLRHYRQVAGLSLAQAALASGYSLRTIHKWEIGQHAPIRFAVEVLADVYGTTADALRSVEGYVRAVERGQVADKRRSG